MSLDEMMLWLLLFAAAMFLCSFALLIYTVAIVLEVRRKVKQFGPPEVIRDCNGRRRQERA